MKPWTRFEAFLGKIVKDPEALAISITPLTRLETYLNDFGQSFRFAPATNPLNRGAFLVSDGTDGTKWVKPLDVQFAFAGTQNTPHCTASYEEILDAIGDHIPLNAYFVDFDNSSNNYYLQLTEWNRQDEEFVFSSITVDSTEVLLYVVCKINRAGDVTILNSSGLPK